MQMQMNSYYPPRPSRMHPSLARTGSAGAAQARGSMIAPCLPTDMHPFVCGDGHCGRCCSGSRQGQAETAARWRRRARQQHLVSWCAATLSSRRSRRLVRVKDCRRSTTTRLSAVAGAPLAPCRIQACSSAPAMLRRWPGSLCSILHGAREAERKLAPASPGRHGSAVGAQATEGCRRGEA